MDFTTHADRNSEIVENTIIKKEDSSRCDILKSDCVSTTVFPTIAARAMMRIKGKLHPQKSKLLLCFSSRIEIHSCAGKR
jgi:hypothetical protein